MVHLDVKPENIFSVNPPPLYDDDEEDDEASSASSSSSFMQIATGEDSAEQPAPSPLQPPPGGMRAAAVSSACADEPEPDPMEPRFKLGDCGLVTRADVTGTTPIQEGDRRYLSRELMEELAMEPGAGRLGWAGLLTASQR
jgi:hypothetical protein